MDSLGDREFVVGFEDESMSRSDVNRCRVWYSGRKPIRRNSTETYSVNTMGFYSLDGGSVCSLPMKGNSESFCRFLGEVREVNGNKAVLMILDNCRIHKTPEVLQTAETMDIHLCFLPPYSPQLNPIEIIWKTMKRVLSRFNPTSRGQVESVVVDTFSKESAKLSYSLGWMKKFMPNLSKKLCQ